jgi:hypothetical protein
VSRLAIGDRWGIRDSGILLRIGFEETREAGFDARDWDSRALGFDEAGSFAIDIEEIVGETTSGFEGYSQLATPAARSVWSRV